MDGWMDGGMEGWMGWIAWMGWMDGNGMEDAWMDAGKGGYIIGIYIYNMHTYMCTYVYRYISIYLYVCV